MSQIFLVIEMIFKGIGLWEDFSKYIVQKRMNEMSVEYTVLMKAVDDARMAKTKSDAYEAQARITANTRK